MSISVRVQYVGQTQILVASVNSSDTTVDVKKG
jgi:hypothetical protein